MPWEGLMGYNRGLIDFDLKLPDGAQLAKVVIKRWPGSIAMGQRTGHY